MSEAGRRRVALVQSAAKDRATTGTGGAIGGHDVRRGALPMSTSRKRTSIVLYGAGGHAKSVIGVMEAQGCWQLAGLLDDDAAQAGARVLGYDVLGGEGTLASLKASGVEGGLVSVGDNAARGLLARRVRATGLALVSIVHPSAFIMKDATMGPGAFIHAGAVVGGDCVIGENVIVSVGSCVGHDCVLGDEVHIAPGVLLGGGAKIGARTFLGMGVAVLPSVQIGRNVIVGANAVVNRDLPDDVLAVGSPARVVRKNA